MKYLNLFVLTLLFACTESPAPPPTETPEAQAQEKPSTNTAVSPPTEDSETSPSNEVLGSYVGYFNAEAYDEDRRPSYSNKITIFLDKILQDTMVVGHSVVAGNSRPFSGTIAMRPDFNHLFEVEVKEPGDDRYDGTFSFLVDTKKEEISGSWKAYKKVPVWERSYTLNQKTFSYNPNQKLTESESFWGNLYDGYDEKNETVETVTPDANAYNASTQELTAEMVENLFKGDLEVMRNAIYARHGYTFKNRRMRYFFDRNVDWYMPITTDVRDQLTALEKKNIELLKRYEEHANAYYDAFGR